MKMPYEPRLTLAEVTALTARLIRGANAELGVTLTLKSAIEQDLVGAEQTNYWSFYIETTPEYPLDKIEEALESILNGENNVSLDIIGGVYDDEGNLTGKRKVTVIDD